jgi:glucose/arabinose dehydrogenase
VTEKAGKLRIIEKGKLLPEPVTGIPAVLDKGQGGLLDVGVHPDYAKNGWIYLSFSDPGPDGSAMTKIVRGKLKGNAFVDVQDIFKAPTDLYLVGPNHFGDRIVFDRKGHIYFSIGERGQGAHAQELNRPNGKVHRLNEDGTVPKDNPFVGQPAAMASIYTYGNRNPQGLTLNAATGVVWEVEHGPRGGDELNLIEPGKNYGWPLVSYANNYDGVPIPSPDTRPDLTKPVIYWNPVIAPGSLTFYNGALFPQWKGSAFIGGMGTQSLNRITFDGKGGATIAERWGVGHRVRDVEVAPDGAIWIAEDANPGGIYRVTPK